MQSTTLLLKRFLFKLPNIFIDNFLMKTYYILKQNIQYKFILVENFLVFVLFSVFTDTNYSRIMHWVDFCLQLRDRRGAADVGRGQEFSGCHEIVQGLGKKCSCCARIVITSLKILIMETNCDILLLLDLLLDLNLIGLSLL
ncbi:hypothetical protein ACJX0J_032484, partial [Zea mays]